MSSVPATSARITCAALEWAVINIAAVCLIAAMIEGFAVYEIVTGHARGVPLLIVSIIGFSIAFRIVRKYVALKKHSPNRCREG
jgi:hypothetical protein